MKIGFLLETYFIPAWLYEAIEKTLSLEHVEPCVLILEETEKKSKGYLTALNDRIFNWYARWDKKRYQKRYINQENDAYLLKDIRILMPDVPTITISKTEVMAIEQFRLDLIFQTTSNVLDEKILQIPTHGVWSYYLIRQGPVGFWESYYNEETIVGMLIRHTHNAFDAEMLAEVVVPTNDERSLSTTCNTLAWNVSPLLQLCMDKLLHTGSPFLHQNHLLIKKNTVINSPSFISTLTMFVKFIYTKCKNPPGYIAQYWSIQIAPNKSGFDTAKLDKKEFKTLKQPKSTFWADPFLLSINDKDYLFFESFDYNKGTGIIQLSEVNQQGLLDEPITILEKPFHLSNPQIFLEGDTLYLLPEQADSGEIALYRCIHFPGKWEKVATILQGGYFFDPILLKKENTWWLFFTEKMATQGASSIYGKLLFSDNLLGPWHEHPMNPISSDCRYSRNGGSIFEQNNQTIRVVQDCSRDYGYKIHLLKITQLSETTYKDELIDSISPHHFDVDGIHSISFSKNLIAIDTRKKTSKRLIFE